jgi:hypothetical protein
MQPERTAFFIPEGFADFADARALQFELICAQDFIQSVSVSAADQGIIPDLGERQPGPLGSQVPGDLERLDRQVRGHESQVGDQSKGFAIDMAGMMASPPSRPTLERPLRLKDRSS